MNAFTFAIAIIMIINIAIISNVIWSASWRLDGAFR